jgi:hypothetical protein
MTPMKTALAALFLALAASAPAAAQTPQCDAETAGLDKLRQEIRANRRGVVERHMELTQAESTAFWPLYDEYLKELAAITKRQDRAMLDYVNVQSRVSNANAARIVHEVISTDVDESRLRERFFRRVATATNPKKAMRFLQIENKIRTLNRFDAAAVVQLVQ